MKPVPPCATGHALGTAFCPTKEQVGMFLRFPNQSAHNVRSLMVPLPENPLAAALLHCVCLTLLHGTYQMGKYLLLV